jgi:hypothetical protein
MTDELPIVRCFQCGWVHVGTPAPEPALDRCFRCKGFAFEVIDEKELLRTVPRGVTLQGLRWPPALVQNSCRACENSSLIHKRARSKRFFAISRLEFRTYQRPN